MARGTLRTDIDEAACAKRLEALFAHEDKLYVGHQGSTKPKEKVGLYSLKRGQNGGADPHASGPWSKVTGGGKFSDCIGTYAWARGLDRFQPERFAHLYGGYCNTDSILMDALGEKAVTGSGKATPAKKLWRVAKAPRPGVAIICPARYEKGKKVKGSYGHVMGIVEVPPYTGPWPGLLAMADKLIVVHCHGGTFGRTKRAIAREPLNKAIARKNIERAHLIELVT